MFEMNTTPLIDVLLVLLVMFIITLPIQTHAIKLDLPADCAKCPAPNSVRNEIVVTRSGATLWNGTAMDQAALGFELRATQRMRPIPELHLRPDAEARYETVDELLALIKGERVQRVGFAGNEAYPNF
jgi:biopolymer transport protein ExbD